MCHKSKLLMTNGLCGECADKVREPKWHYVKSKIVINGPSGSVEAGPCATSILTGIMTRRTSRHRLCGSDTV